MDAPNYFLLFGILIIVVGFMIRVDAIAVIVVSAITTSFIAGISIVETLELMGKSFVNARFMSLFFLILPVVGICERYGMREQAAVLIKKLTFLTTGRLLIVYHFIRQLFGAFSIRVNGHPQFVRPLVEPMASGAANRFGKVSPQVEEEIKAFSAASENFGNFFGQNLFFAAAGVLLVAGVLTEQGFSVSGIDVAKWSIPVAVAALLITSIRFLMFDQKIKHSLQAKEKKPNDHQ